MVLQAIINRWDKLEPVNTLTGISTNALTESALEQKFLDALARLQEARLSPKLVRGKAGYLLSLPGADGRPVAWEIEQQVRVGAADGVAVGTDIDFVLWPAREQDKGRCHPIAVYTDGLQYHRSLVADDVVKRTALLRSGRFHVWTLTWDDLPDPTRLDPPAAAALMQAPALVNQTEAVFDQLAPAAGWERAASQRAKAGWRSFAWLEKILREPVLTTTECVAQATFRALTALAPQASGDNGLRQAMQQELATCTPPILQTHLALDDAAHIVGGVMAALDNALPHLKLAASLPASVLQAGIAPDLADALRVVLYLDDEPGADADEFKTAWRSFWHAVNQLQFLPGFAMSTRLALAEDRLEQLWSRPAQTPEEDAPADKPAAFADQWQEALELSALPAQQIQALAALGLPAPEVGVDLVDANGVIVLGGDVVELAWRTQRVAVLNADVDVALPQWHLVVVDDSLESRLQQLMTTEEIF